VLEHVCDTTRDFAAGGFTLATNVKQYRGTAVSECDRTPVSPVAACEEAGNARAVTAANAAAADVQIADNLRMDLPRFAGYGCHPAGPWLTGRMAGRVPFCGYANIWAFGDRGLPATACVPRCGSRVHGGTVPCISLKMRVWDLYPRGKCLGWHQEN